MKNSNNRYLCIIPARGGSKGIPKKNLSKIGQESLLGNTIMHAKKSLVFDYIHVSTDSVEIQKEALKYGASCEFLRPKKYANDIIGTKEAIKSSISKLQEFGQYFEFIFELQPTYVFRKIKTIKDMSSLILGFDSVVTVKKVKDTSHPDYICSSDEDLLIHGKNFADKFNRHELRNKYAIVGLVLASRVEVLMNHDSIYKTNCGFYEIDNQIELLDINDREDLMICRGVYKELQSNKNE